MKSSLRLIPLTCGVLGFLMFGCDNPTSQQEDIVPPTVELTAPQDSATVYGSVNLQAAASDNQSVTAVRFYVDGQQAGVSEAVPYEHLWESTLVSDNTWHAMYARAEDEAGNTAQSDTISLLVDNTVPGDSGTVMLQEPAGVGKYQATINWEFEDTARFDRYRLYRNTGAFVDSTDVLVLEFSIDLHWSATDTGLSRATEYAYRMYLTDTLNRVFESKKIRVTTKEIVPVRVKNVELQGETQARVLWEKSSEPDFAAYRIRREEGRPADDDSPVIQTVADQNTTALTDRGLERMKVFYYRVDVVDGHDNWRAGSQDSVITDIPPEPVTLSVVNANHNGVHLSWTASSVDDFQRYEIYRSIHAGVSRDDRQVFTDDNQQRTQYQDIDIGTGVTYYYRIFVVDQLNQVAGSNEVTVDIAP